MTIPKTFEDYLDGLPDSHPVRDAHDAWNELFNEVVHTAPIVEPLACRTTAMRLINLTTTLRSALEDDGALDIPVVASYARLLSADCEVLKSNHRAAA